MNNPTGSTRTTDERFAGQNPWRANAGMIITKDNIGLANYQHQMYQYHLFNHRSKHDQYYEDMHKVKSRMSRTLPDMQRVVHTDLQRDHVNRFYDRQLQQAVSGPRGLHWQHRLA